jgi:hypothetical protein
MSSTNLQLDDPRTYANRLDQGYIDVMSALQFARKKSLISAKFAQTFNSLLSECYIRLKNHIEPAATAKRRQLAEQKNK